jgi:CrcB protein
MSIKILLLVGTGSFLGGIARYVCSLPFYEKGANSFPWWTLLVNLLGCLLMGFLFGFAERWNVPKEWKLFFAAGLLGGFTTFSAFSYETVALLNNGQYAYAISYVLSSVLLGLFATVVGLNAVRWL